jgi:tryptophan-rich sensory protein
MAILSEPHSTSSFKKGLIPKIIVSCVVIMMLGGLSGYITQAGATSWFKTLIKPTFQPPNWLFGPAWTTLYLLMGISFGRIWQVSSKSRYPIIRKYALRGMAFFGFHFLFNLAWTPAFFGLENPTAALVIIFILLVLIAFLIKHFLRLDRVAAFLLIPYFLWVTFATVLNLSIVILN